MKKFVQTLFDKKKDKTIQKTEEKEENDQDDFQTINNRHKTTVTQQDNARVVLIESPHDGWDVLAVLMLSDGTILSSGSMWVEEKPLPDNKKNAKHQDTHAAVESVPKVEKGCLKRWTTEGQLLQSVTAPTPVYSLMEISSSEHGATVKHFVSCSLRSIDVWMMVCGRIRHIETVINPHNSPHPPIVPIQQLLFRVNIINNSSSNSRTGGCDRYFMTQAVAGLLFWRASIESSQTSTAPKGVTVTAVRKHWIPDCIEFAGCQLSDGRVCVLLKLREISHSKLLTLGEDSNRTMDLMQSCSGITEVETSGVVATCVSLWSSRGFIAFYEVTSGLVIRALPVFDKLDASNRLFIRSVDRSLICVASRSELPLLMRLWDTQSGADVLQVDCINANDSESLNNRFYVGCSTSGISRNVDRNSSDSNSSTANDNHFFIFGEGIQTTPTYGYRANRRSPLIIARVTLPQAVTNSKPILRIPRLFNKGMAHTRDICALTVSPLDGSIWSML